MIIATRRRYTKYIKAKEEKRSDSSLASKWSVAEPARNNYPASAPLAILRRCDRGSAYVRRYNKLVVLYYLIT